MTDNCVPPKIRPLGDENTCSGRNSQVQGANLFSYYCDNNCPGTFASILNTLPNGTLGFNQANLPIVQQDITNLFNTYLKTNIITSSIGATGYSSFKNTLLSLCLDDSIPGGCDQFLGGTGHGTSCNRDPNGGFCAGFTRDELIGNEAVLNFCGCYASPDPNYSSIVPRVCDPICHRATTVQLTDLSSGDFCECQSNLCIIDDVTVQLYKSNVGGITFQQVCPACPAVSGPTSYAIGCTASSSGTYICGNTGGFVCGCTGSPVVCSCTGPTGSGCNCLGTSCTCMGATSDIPLCECIIAGVSVESVMSDVGIGSQFTQICGANSICVQIPPGATAGSTGTVVNCSTVNPNTSSITTFSSAVPIYIIIIVVIIFLFIILLMLATKSKDKVLVTKTIVQTKPGTGPVMANKSVPEYTPQSHGWSC